MKVQKAIFPGLMISFIFLVSASAFLRQTYIETSESGYETKNHSEHCHLSENFPDSIHNWCDLIQNNANEYGVDPRLIAAVMLQESGGDPRAYSSSGAVGLMQVMPKDGIAAGFICPNGPCFSSRPSMQELYDPEFNVAYGARMLSGLIEKHGNYRDALRAYGPMDVGYYYADIVLSIFQNY